MENWESKNTRKEPGSVCDQKIHAYFAHAYAQHSSVRRLMVQRLMNHGKRWCCQAVGQISSRFSALLSPAILTSLGGQKNSTLWSIPFRLIFVGLTQKRVRIFVLSFFNWKHSVLESPPQAKKNGGIFRYVEILVRYFPVRYKFATRKFKLAESVCRTQHNIPPP